MAQYAHCDRVVGGGNVVTGQGNIRSSLVHSQKVMNRLIEQYIGVAEETEGAEEADFSAFSEPAVARGVAQAEAVREKIQTLPAPSTAQIAEIEQRIQALHGKMGYTGDYDTWIAKITPP